MAFNSYRKAIETIRFHVLDTNNLNLKSRLVSSAFWASIGGIISRGSMLLAFIVVARMLGKETYGEFSIIRSTANMFVMFAGFGLGMTATKYIAEYKYSQPALAGRVITLSNFFAFFTASIVSLAVYFIAPWIAENTINAPHLSYELRLGAIILFFSAMNGAQTGVLTGLEAFRTISQINIITGIFSVIVLAVGTYYWGLNGAVIALVVNAIFNWLLNFFTIRKTIGKFGIRTVTLGWWKEKSILWKFSLPATLGGLLVSPVLWYCNSLLVNQPDGFNKLGVFDAAFQWYTVILFIPGLLSRIVLPILSDLNEKNKKDYVKALKFSLLINGGLSLLLAVIFSLLSSFIMGIYGEDFVVGKWVLIWLTLSAILVSLNNVVGQAIISKGKMWMGTSFNIMWALSLIMFTIFFLNRGYGAVGLALSYFCSYSLHSIIQVFYLIKLLKNPLSNNTYGLFH